MGKGLRSKVKRRFRTAKREILKQTLEKAEIERCNSILTSSAETGIIASPAPQPLNAFLHPSDPDAVVPQKKNFKMLDLRSDSSFATYAKFAGVGSRKLKSYTDEEKILLGLPGCAELRAIKSRESEHGAESFAYQTGGRQLGSQMEVE